MIMDEMRLGYAWSIAERVAKLQNSKRKKDARAARFCGRVFLPFRRPNMSDLKAEHEQNTFSQLWPRICAMNDDEEGGSLKTHFSSLVFFSRYKTGKVIHHQSSVWLLLFILASIQRRFPIRR